MKASLLALALALPPVNAAPPEARDVPRPPARVDLPAEEVRVPMPLFNNRPIVDVVIDGKGPFPFVLDTGAAGTVVEEELAKELALPKTGELRIGDPLKPHAIQASEVRIDWLEIGDAVFSGVTASAIAGSGFASHLGARGVLGMPLFADLLLTLDYGRGEVTIARGGLPAPDGREVLDLARGPHGTLRVPLRVGGVAVEADLDSGSPGGINLPEKLEKALPLEGAPVEVGRARTVSSEFVMRGATLAGAAELGAHRIEKPRLRFSALPPNVGFEVLCRFAVTLDQKANRVRFRLSAPLPPAPTEPAATGLRG